MLSVYDYYAVGHRLDTTDTLEATAAGHGIFHDGVQRNSFQSTSGVLIYCFVYGFVSAQLLIDYAFLLNDLAGSGGLQLVGSLCIQP